MNRAILYTFPRPYTPTYTHPRTYPRLVYSGACFYAWVVRAMMWVCMGVRVRRWPADIVGKGYRMALPRDYRNRAILYTFPPIYQSFLRTGIVGEGEGRKGISYAYLPLPPYQPVFPPGGIVGEGLGCRYLGSQPFPRINQSSLRAV